MQFNVEQRGEDAVFKTKRLDESAGLLVLVQPNSSDEWFVGFVEEQRDKPPLNLPGRAYGCINETEGNPASEQYEWLQEAHLEVRHGWNHGSKKK